MMNIYGFCFILLFLPLMAFAQESDSVDSNQDEETSTEFFKLMIFEQQCRDSVGTKLSPLELRMSEFTMSKITSKLAEYGLEELSETEKEIVRYHACVQEKRILDGVSPEMIDLFYRTMNIQDNLEETKKLSEKIEDDLTNTEDALTKIQKENTNSFWISLTFTAIIGTIGIIIGIFSLKNRLH